jgi:hypothetical protein
LPPKRFDDESTEIDAVRGAEDHLKDVHVYLVGRSTPVAVLRP